MLRVLEESRLLVDGAIHSTLDRSRIPGRTVGWRVVPRGLVL